MDENPLFVSVFNDITDLKNLDRLKTDLIRTVSHEIRTPMTIIQSYCDLALELQDDALTYEYISKISNKTEELTVFLSEFLDLNRLEANMVTLSFTQISLKGLLSEVIEGMNILAQSKNIRIITDLRAESWVLADENRLKQVFENILSNALKYSPIDTEVKIELDKDKDYAIVLITDQGFGIPEEHQAKVFEKFYRVYSEETKNIVGTGLGLSIVKKIIEMHKGNISLVSNISSGTVFTVNIPLVEKSVENH